MRVRYAASAIAVATLLLVGTSAGAIRTREADRKKLAAKLFDNPRSNPRPILEFGK